MPNVFVSLDGSQKTLDSCNLIFIPQRMFKIIIHLNVVNKFS